MSEIKLTGTLKTYKAVVVWGNAQPPEGYVSVAGSMVNGENVEIAIPETMLHKDINLFNRLADQAENCLFNASDLWVEDNPPLLTGGWS